MFHGDEPKFAEDWLYQAKDLSNEHPTAAQLAALIAIGTFLYQIRDMIKGELLLKHGLEDE